jgi:hypothetical protein
MILKIEFIKLMNTKALNGYLLTKRYKIFMPFIERDYEVFNIKKIKIRDKIDLSIETNNYE